MKKSTTLVTKENTTGSTALMYRINNGLTGSVITITARKDFTLAAKTVDTKTREIMADAPVYVVAGTVLHFIKSSLSGWYYIGRVCNGKASCSCPSRYPCKHDPLIMAAHETKQSRKVVLSVSAPCPQDVNIVPEVCHEEEEEYTEDKANVWTEEEIKRIREAAIVAPKFSTEERILNANLNNSNQGFSLLR